MIYIECRSNMGIEKLKEIISKVDLDPKKYKWVIGSKFMKNSDVRLKIYTNDIVDNWNKYLSKFYHSAKELGKTFKVSEFKSYIIEPKRMTWVEVIENLTSYDRDAEVVVNHSSFFSPTNNFEVSSNVWMNTISITKEVCEPITARDMIVLILRFNNHNELAAIKVEDSIESISDVRLIDGKIVLFNGWVDGVPMYWGL